MCFAGSYQRAVNAMIGVVANPSIIPVLSEAIMSVEEITTGWKPASFCASAAAGSPAQAKTRAPLASPGLRISFLKNM